MSAAVDYQWFRGNLELDKSHPDEVRELLHATIATIRSWKPQVLLVAEAQQEGSP